MDEVTQPSKGRPLVRIEPQDRLVVLARTMNASESRSEALLADRALKWRRLGETCLGQALYRHRSLFQNASEAPQWSHLELSYFRDLVPDSAIDDLVVRQPPQAIELLRAELLLTTPSSFVLPHGWQGLGSQSNRQASLEYIQVEPRYLGAYRDVMRDYCGIAASRLVQFGRFGTFRAMETLAVLHQDKALGVEWNQIHLCELEPDGFEGFGPEFEAALRQGAPKVAEAPGVFAGLDRMRSVPRWTFNDAVVEADAALGQEGRWQR